MIMVFSDVSSEYFHNITFNDKNSFSDFKLTISPESDIPIAQPKIISESVPFADGSYDFSMMDGKLHYDNLTWNYVLNIIGDNVEELIEKQSEVVNWLYAGYNVELHDSNYTDWKFIGAKCTSIKSQIEKRGLLFIDKITATITAYPKRQKNGTVVMTVAEFTPAANTSEYVWFYAGDKLCYNSIGSTDIFDIKNISADKKIITATINVTNWNKGVVKIQVPSFIEQVLARIDGNILTPSITLDSQYYYVVGSGHHVLSLTFTAYSQVSISDVMAQYVTAVGFPTSFIANTPPNPNNMMISSVDSLPQVNINGVVADTNNIELSDDITVMEISGAKNDRLRLIYDDVEYML